MPAAFTTELCFNAIAQGIFQHGVQLVGYRSQKILSITASNRKELGNVTIPLRVLSIFKARRVGINRPHGNESVFDILGISGMLSRPLQPSLFASFSACQYTTFEDLGTRALDIMFNS